MTLANTLAYYDTATISSVKVLLYRLLVSILEFFFFGAEAKLECFSCNLATEV
jgi:hypothetical protein